MARFSQEPQGDGTTVLSAGGEIDLAVAEEFFDVAQACLEQNDGLGLDLSGVTFIDSSGLGALVRIRKEADAQSKPFSLVSTSRSVERLLEVTGLGDIFSASAPT